MKKVLEKWQYSFLTVPIIAILLIYGLYKSLYPLLSYDTFPFKISSLSTIKILALLNSFLIPFVISLIYKLRIFIAIVIWTSCTGLALILDKGVYDGNPNWALSFSLFPYQLLAIFLTIAWVIISKRNAVSV